TLRAEPLTARAEREGERRHGCAPGGALPARPEEGRRGAEREEKRVKASQRGAWAAVGLTAPAYIWLAATIFLPLSAMLYFSFRTRGPFGTEEVHLTLHQYSDYFAKSFYLFL